MSLKEIPYSPSRRTAPKAGVLVFGGEATTGDTAQGFSTGDVVTGGIYAFDVGGDNLVDLWHI